MKKQASKCVEAMKLVLFKINIRWGWKLLTISVLQYNNLETLVPLFKKKKIIKKRTEKL